MNTKTFTIVLVGIALVIFVIWLIKKFGKSGNKSTTPSNTDTITPRTTTIMATGGITTVERTLFDNQASQRVPGGVPGTGRQMKPQYGFPAPGSATQRVNNNLQNN